MLIDDYGGVVPGSMDERLKLPRIGRKTATVALGEAMGPQALRSMSSICGWNLVWGLSTHKTAEKMEAELYGAGAEA